MQPRHQHIAMLIERSDQFPGTLHTKSQKALWEVVETCQQTLGKGLLTMIGSIDREIIQWISCACAAIDIRAGLARLNRSLTEVISEPAEMLAISLEYHILLLCPGQAR